MGHTQTLKVGKAQGTPKPTNIAHMHVCIYILRYVCYTHVTIIHSFMLLQSVRIALCYSKRCLLASYILMFCLRMQQQWGCASSLLNFLPGSQICWFTQKGSQILKQNCDSQQYPIHKQQQHLTPHTCDENPLPKSVLL